jgi:hypothetical protein
MSNRFAPTRQNNPCLLCGDTKGKCRQTESENLHLCMNLSEPLPGFKYVGQTKDGLWGKYIVDEGHPLNEDDRALLQLQRQQRLAEETQRRAESLPATERDRLYSQLLDQLTLHPDDRADLHRRGFTDDQIKQWGVRSVEQWQRLSIELPHTLPGVNLDGQSLNTPYPGYLCPVKDVDQLIVGFQIRSRNPRPGHPKYYWLTSKTKKRPNGSSPHLPSGELPLTIIKPQQSESGAIALVEGTGAKPHLLAERLGIVTIGAAGGQFAVSSKMLVESLVKLSEELGTKEIQLYPDAGAVQNKHVLRQYRSTFKVLRRSGFEIQIAWWCQEDKRVHVDIDELEDISQIEFISVVEFEKIAARYTGLIDQLRSLLGKLSRPRTEAKGFERGSNKSLRCRLGQRRKPTDDQARSLLILLQGNRSTRRLIHKLWVIPKSEPTPILEYQPGNRLQVWKNAIDQGYRYVLDLSPPGTGKSYDSGQVLPDDFGVKQVIYLSDQHRNPTVETLGRENGWEDLEARHGGLKRVSTTGGSRLQRLGKEEIPVVTANCSRNGVLNELRNKNISGADTASIICGTCILREPCCNAEGPGYGYLFQRRNTLGSPQLRAHPDSLPDINDYSLEDVLLLWDEPGQNFRIKKQVTVSYQDLQQTITTLIGNPEIFATAQALLSALLPLLDGSAKLSKFGFDFNYVKAHLPNMDEVNVGAIASALTPQLGYLNTTSDYGVDLADLPRELRKRFSDRDGEMAEQTRGQVVKQWLPELIGVLQGQPGSVHVGHRGMIITLPDWRHRAIAHAAYGNVFLDGTLTREDLALKLGCSPDEIQVVRQAIPDRHNLKIIQVADVGRAGMSRGNDQHKRVDALIGHFKAEDPATKIIDFKKFGADGAWWRDSRGVNDFLETKTLLLVGAPCRNLIDLASEYAIATGSYPSEHDSRFASFVNRAILAEIHQAIGRLRAHRRPLEMLKVVLISNVELDFPVQQTNASEIAPGAGSKTERVQTVIANTIEQLKLAGQKVTQQMVAEVTDLPRGTIARYWSLFISLLKGSNSKMNKKESDTDEVELNQAIASVLNNVAAGEANELLSSIEEVFFQWLKPDQWLDVWEYVSGQAQLVILEALSMTLPGGVVLGLERSRGMEGAMLGLS